MCLTAAYSLLVSACYSSAVPRGRGPQLTFGEASACKGPTLAKRLLPLNHCPIGLHLPRDLVNTKG
jgi:hypothetical protein